MSYNNGSYLVLYLSPEPIYPPVLYWNTTQTSWNKTTRLWNFDQSEQQPTNNEKLLLSKSHSLSFEAQMVDASPKIGNTKQGILVWNTTFTKWQNETTKWNAARIIRDGGNAEYIAGQKAGSFSADGLVFNALNVFDFWEDQEEDWDQTELEWDDETSTDVFSVNAELRSYIINRTELNFSLVWEQPNEFANTVYTGKCYISEYEMVASNEDVYYFNAEFKITKPLTRVLEITWDRVDEFWDTTEIVWDEDIV